MADLDVIECPHCGGNGVRIVSECNCDAEWNPHTCVEKCEYCQGTGRMHGD